MSLFFQDCSLLSVRLAKYLFTHLWDNLSQVCGLTDQAWNEIQGCWRCGTPQDWQTLSVDPVQHVCVSDHIVSS